MQEALFDLLLGGAAQPTACTTSSTHPAHGTDPRVSGEGPLCEPPRIVCGAALGILLRFLLPVEDYEVRCSVWRRLHALLINSLPNARALLSQQDWQDWILPHIARIARSAQAQSVRRPQTGIHLVAHLRRHSRKIGGGGSTLRGHAARVAVHCTCTKRGAATHTRDRMWAHHVHSQAVPVDCSFFQ